MVKGSITEIEKILQLVSLAERLKVERRNGRTSHDLRESVADHSWRLSLMVMLLAPHFDFPLDVAKAMKMAIIHDFPEIFAGDIPYFMIEGNAQVEAERFDNEKEAMFKIRDVVGQELGVELLSLWEEFEQGKTNEARFVKALDKIESQIQHNQADFKFWNEHDLSCAMSRLDPYCNFSSLLVEVKEHVQKNSALKMQQGL